MLKKAHLSILLTLLLVITTLASANAQTNVERITVSEIDDSEFPQLALFVTPLERSGVPIDGLSASDLQILADGRLIAARNYVIDEAIDPAETIEIVLALDLSGSMQSSLDGVRQAALTLVDELDNNPDDRIAIIGFNELTTGGVNLRDPFPQFDETRELPFTTDKNRVRNFLNTVIAIPDGNAGTPLYDAMYKAVRLLATESSFGRRAVIVITDGRDTDRRGIPPGSRVATDQDVISEARAEQIPVYTIGLGDELDETVLQRIATMTGGTYSNQPDAGELGERFSQIARNLKIKYNIRIRDAGIASDNQPHQLTVTVGDASADATFTARYPVKPWLQELLVTLPGQEPRRIDTLDSVKGIVTVEPNIAARNPILSVGYYINTPPSENGTPALLALDAPFAFRWDTTALPPDQAHTLYVEIVDDTQQNVTLESFDILVEACNLICRIEETTGISAWVLLSVVGLGLLLLVLLLASSRRQPAVMHNPSLPSPSARLGDNGPVGGRTVVDPPVNPPPPTSPVSVPNEPPRAPAKTEVLRVGPTVIAQLVELRTGRQHKLGDTNRIGRDAQNDIVIDDDTVSSRHASLRLDGRSFVITDLDSSNHLFVNGAKVDSVQLKDDDRIKLGRVELVFRQIETGK